MFLVLEALRTKRADVSLGQQLLAVLLDRRVMPCVGDSVARVPKVRRGVMIVATNPDVAIPRD